MAERSISPAIASLIVGLVTGFIWGWTNPLVLLLILIGTILGILIVVKKPLVSGDKGHAGHAVILILLIGGLAFFGVGLAGMGSQAKTADTIGNTAYPTPTIPLTGMTGTPVQGDFIFTPLNNASGIYAGAGVIYLLDPASAVDVNDFRADLAQGLTSKLKTPNGGIATPKSVSAGSFTWLGQTFTVGQRVTLAGYLDITPAAGENISFKKDVIIDGVCTQINCGGTSQIAWHLADTTNSREFPWYNYASTAWFSSSDVAITAWQENQTSTVEKHIKVTIHPNAIGTGMYGGHIWLESPLSNIGAIEDVTISRAGSNLPSVTIPRGQFIAQSNLNSGSPLVYTAGVVGLTTAADTLYSIADLPETVRFGNSGVDYGAVDVDIRYIHPASGTVLIYLKSSFNSNSLTSTGGSFAGPTLATNLSAATPLGQSSS
jgi:hypothetical protein